MNEQARRPLRHRHLWVSLLVYEVALYGLVLSLDPSRHFRPHFLANAPLSGFAGFFWLAVSVIPVIVMVCAIARRTLVSRPRTAARHLTGQLIVFFIALLILYLLYATATRVHRIGEIKGFWDGVLVQGFSATMAALAAASIAVYTVLLSGEIDRRNQFVTVTQMQNDRIRYLIVRLNSLSDEFRRRATQQGASVSSAAQSLLFEEFRLRRGVPLKDRNAFSPQHLFNEILSASVSTNTNAIAMDRMASFAMVFANFDRNMISLSRELLEVRQDLVDEFGKIGLRIDGLLVDIDVITDALSPGLSDLLEAIDEWRAGRLPDFGLVRGDRFETCKQLTLSLWLAICLRLETEMNPLGLLQRNSLEYSLARVFPSLSAIEIQEFFMGALIDDRMYRELRSHFRRFTSSSTLRANLEKQIELRYVSSAGFTVDDNDGKFTLYELWNSITTQVGQVSLRAGVGSRFGLLDFSEHQLVNSLNLERL